MPDLFNTQGMSAKKIDTLVKDAVIEMPDTWNECDYYAWDISDNPKVKYLCRGSFYSKKMKQINALIKETNATVHISGELITITYPNGNAKIFIDPVINHFLIINP